MRFVNFRIKRIERKRERVVFLMKPIPLDLILLILKLDDLYTNTSELVY